MEIDSNAMLDEIAQYSGSRTLDSKAKDLLDTLAATVDTLQPGEITIVDYVERFGVSKTTARRKLDEFEKSGVLTSRLVAVNGTMTRAWSATDNGKPATVVSDDRYYDGRV